MSIHPAGQSFRRQKVSFDATASTPGIMTQVHKKSHLANQRKTAQLEAAWLPFPGTGGKLLRIRTFAASIAFRSSPISLSGCKSFRWATCDHPRKQVESGFS
jgi:hypothetical protein